MVESMSRLSGPRTIHHCVVWANGMQHLEGILDHLESPPQVRLHHLEFTEYRSVVDMIAKVYATDDTPVKHLFRKNAFLNAYPAYCVHVIISTEASPLVAEKVNGNIALFDPKVRSLKWEIRQKFNKRTHDGEISQNHVIHISDNQVKASKTLALNLGRKSVRIAESINDETMGMALPWHQLPLKRVTVGTIESNRLRARIIHNGIPKIVCVESTPHFASAVSGDFKIYEAYLKKHRGVELTDWYSVRKFSSLLTQSSPGEWPPPLVREISVSGEKRFLILDGLHRSVASKLRGEQSIVVAVV